MRKFSVLLFLAAALTMQGQVFTSVSVKKVSGTEPADIKLAAISPKGDYVLTTNGSNKGLNKMVLATSEVTPLTTEAGAGFEPSISQDGEQVIYRNVQFNEEHMRMTSLKTMNVGSKLETELRKPSREVKAYGFKGKDAFILDDDNALVMPSKSKALTPKAEVAEPSVFTEDLQLMVSTNGKTVQLSPNGTDQSYIWPSLSPDGSKILYYVSGEGAYVCDIDGQNVKFINHDCRAPKWFDNNTIIGMDDEDDGEVVTSSCIVAYTLDGQHQQLTSPYTFTMYPCCAPEAGVVACSTVYGEIYLINLKK